MGLLLAPVERTFTDRGYNAVCPATVLAGGGPVVELGMEVVSGPGVGAAALGRFVATVVAFILFTFPPPPPELQRTFGMGAFSSICRMLRM